MSSWWRVSESESVSWRERVRVSRSEDRVELEVLGLFIRERIEDSALKLCRFETESDCSQFCAICSSIQCVVSCFLLLKAMKKKANARRFICIFIFQLSNKTHRSVLFFFLFIF